MNFTISTDQMVSASDARKNFAQLLKKVSSKNGTYYMILQNGKPAGALVGLEWLKENRGEDFMDFEEIRKSWNRYGDEFADAFEALEKIDAKKLPKLLR